MDLALNNLQWWICHKTETTKQPLAYPTISISLTIHGHQILKCFLSSLAKGISPFLTDSQNTTYTTESVKEKRNTDLG